MANNKRLLALLAGEPPGELCAVCKGRGEGCGMDYTSKRCGNCHGTGRINTTPEGEVEEAVARLRHAYKHAHLRDGWGCRQCRTIFTDESLQYDRENRFAVPVCPRCDPVSRDHATLLLKATFDVWDAERERDAAQRELAQERQSFLEVKEERNRLGRELVHVDEILARRSALDDLPTRVEKIERAINVAKRADGLERELAEVRARVDVDWNEKRLKWLNARVRELEGALQVAKDAGWFEHAESWCSKTLDVEDCAGCTCERALRGEKP